MAIANPRSKTAREVPHEIRLTVDRWAIAIDKLHRIDRATWDEIAATIEWVIRHRFWSGVILSAPNLREKWDKIQIQRQRDEDPTPSRLPRGTGRHEPTPGEYADGEQSL